MHSVSRFGVIISTAIHLPFREYVNIGQNFGAVPVPEYKVANLCLGTKVGTQSLNLSDAIYYFVYSSLPAMLKFQNYVWHGEMEQMCTRLHIRYPRCAHNSISCRYPTLALEVRSRNTEDEIRVRSHLVSRHKFPGAVQNSALSTLWVPELSFVHFASSADAIFAKGAKKLTVGKSPRNQQKTRAHRDPVPTLVPEYKVSTSYSGTGTRARILARVLKNGMVTLVPSEYRPLVPVPGHQVWTYPNSVHGLIKLPRLAPQCRGLTANYKELFFREE